MMFKLVRLPKIGLSLFCVEIMLSTTASASAYQSAACREIKTNTSNQHLLTVTKIITLQEHTALKSLSSSA